MNLKARLFLLLAAACLPATTRAADFAVPSAAGGRFLLLDRQDPSKIFVSTPAAGTEVPAGAAPAASGEGALDEISGELPFSYSQDSWNSAREAVETGKFAAEPEALLPEISVSTEAPASPEPQVEFKDSGTSLSVTGRKVISVNYSGKRYLYEQTSTSRARSTSLFEITQQMQVKMQGKVGQKISVNVDYDDTKTDKQDISVVYQGDPNEVVQNVSFGDIDLSLPSTEFVSYNKQLFGIRTDLKTNRFKMTLVGSRTKGETKTKQFTGNTQFQKADISDTSYLRRKYYDLTFGNAARLPIKASSEKIYIDRQTSEAVDNVTVFAMTGDDLEVPSSTYTGRFKLMNRGVDYVMDYVNGIVTFNSALNSNDVVIIDFQNANGVRLAVNTSSYSYTGTTGTGNYKIIKAKDDTYISTTTEAGYDRELKTYYSIGQTNIVRDNGNGNFTLKVQDLSHNYVGSSLDPQQVYSDDITVDFEQGIFHLTKPFGSSGVPAVPDPEVYAASPVSKRLIHVEYYYRFKTFTLDSNIVLNSEVVRVDGVKYTRNTDYFIDYDSGFITFYYPDRIGQDSKIEIVYEVSQYGGTGNQSLVGGRVSYDLGGHFSLGSTMLYQGGVKANTVPSVSDVANSMLVYEGDAQLKNLRLLGLNTTLGAEAARSVVNPNLNGYALIDNMESAKQEDSAPTDKNYWVIASNPRLGPASPNAVTWSNETVKSKEINPNSTSDGSQQVLTVGYDFSASSEVSIAYPLSATGLDFSQKTALEMILYGQNSPGVPGPEVNIHYGQIDEDADGQGGQTFTCSSGLTLYGYPKSEDVNCDGQVSSSEDTGWLYAPDGKPSKRFGAGNGRLDSEDLNGNGRLDSQDFTGGDFGYVNGSTFKDGNDSGAQKNTVDFTGWHTLTTQMPITSTDSYKWNAVKQIRITLRQAPGGAVSGVVKFARVSAVGNTWSVAASSGTGALLTSALNSVDNAAEYTPIYDAGGEATKVFNDLYGSVSELKKQNNTSTLSEQTLAITYDAVTSTSNGYVYRTYSQALDISQHKKLHFLVNSVGLTRTPSGSWQPYFYIRAGGDSSYYKARFKLPSAPGWHLITLNQDDVTGDSIPDLWTSDTLDVQVSSVGTPSLQQISQFRVGVEADPADTGSYSGKLYFNELYLEGPITRTGNARKVEGSVEVPGWLTVGGKHRYVDRSFQTPVTAITNQDNEQSSGYMNLTRLAFFPVNVTASRQITVTPNAAVTGTNNLVTALQEGRVKKFDGTAAGTLSIGSLPKIGLNYTKGVVDYNTLARTDNKDVYAASLSYNPSWSVFLLPRSLSLNYSLTHNVVDYDPAQLSTLSGVYNTDERTDAYGVKLGFVPWNGATLNPGYSLQTVREERYELSDPTTPQRYPKSMQQTAEFNSGLPLAKWLNPSVNYSMTTTENNNLTVTTATIGASSQTFDVGQIKAVTRSAQGAVSLTLNMNDFLPRNRLLRSMVLSSSYQLQDGDSWNYVEKDFDTRHSLWIRDSLKPANPYAQRGTLTTRDTINSSQRWQPLEGYSFGGPAGALNTLNITDNYTISKQRSEVTGTLTRTQNRTFPDMIVSMSQLEKLLRAQNWAQNSTVNLKYSLNTNETREVSVETTKSYGLDLRSKILQMVDSALSYNLKTTEYDDLSAGAVTKRSRHDDATVQGAFDHGKFHFTPKVDYTSDITKGALGATTANTRTVTPSLLVKTDLQLPKGLKLPFSDKVIALTNRIVWTTTISYALKSSPITSADNTRLFSLTSSADYEAAKNLRLTFNAGLQRLWSKHVKEDEYMSYQAGSTLTFQF